MKTTRLLFACYLLCLFSATAQPPQPVEGINVLPWATMYHSYCAIRKSSTYPFAETPLPGKQIDVYTQMRAGTDWHTHQFFDSVARPVGSYQSSITMTTVLNAAGTEACTPDFAYRNANFSGIIDTTMQGSRVADNLPTVTWFNRLKVSDYDYNGNPSPFVKLMPNTFTGPLDTPVDTRHWDQNGQPGYSRYGKAVSVHMMRVMLYNFALHGGTAHNIIPRVLTGSLPNGGWADNRFNEGGLGYALPSWGVLSYAETHQYGLGWDIENPAVTVASRGGTTQEALDVWLVFKASVTGSGCRFGKLNPQTGFPFTDYKDMGNKWVVIPVVHLDCLFVPQ
jgi:hypothetical protein